MLRTLVSLQVLTLTAGDRLRRRLAADERGQSTAEYALVLLGAAGVALLLITWATKTDKVTRLLNGVIDRVLGQVT
jgi:Flp pilus assembly pilin Flp